MHVEASGNCHRCPSPTLLQTHTTHFFVDGRDRRLVDIIVDLVVDIVVAELKLVLQLVARILSLETVRVCQDLGQS